MNQEFMTKDYKSKKTSPARTGPIFDNKSPQTLETISRLIDSGIDKMAVISRHSARFYPQEAGMEPFMGLTDQGKAFAFDLGKALPARPKPSFFSSIFGRCIETAYLIDKGHTSRHGFSLAHNTTSEWLAPFYIKDIKKALDLVQAQGTTAFIRNWLAGRIEGSIMENPCRTAEIITEYMTERLKNLGDNELAFCVSHDWNIYPLKEFKLELDHETYGDVGYLDAVIFYEEKGAYYITSSQSAPKKLE